MKSILLLTLLFASCKHLPDLSEKDSLDTVFCTEVAGDTLCAYQWQFPPPAIGYQFLPDPMVHAHYSCPSVNPNNPNQFVCFRQDFNWPPKAAIITYDMSTETETELFNFTGVMFGNLSWGKKDWIAFTQGAGTIRIFKSDGSDGRQIAESSGMNFFQGTGPEWSPMGDLLYYHTFRETPPTGIISDTNGTIISYPKIINRPDWNSNNIIVGADGWLLSTLDLNTNTRNDFTQWTPVSEADAVSFIEWLPDNCHAVFSKDIGLYRVNTHTGEILQMKESCDMKRYNALSISNEGNFILCEKIMSRHPSSFKALYRHEIWKMDINGCNEVRVLPK